MLKEENLNKVLIVSIIPYFLERGNLWFEENFEKILKIRKTQSWWQDNTLILERNQIFHFSQFLRKLDELGYEKVYNVGDIGEFSQRGGIIDVFPINLNFPLRFEFLGNKILEIERLKIELKNEKEAKERLKKKLKYQKIYSQLGHLKTGDLLVHLDHGIGIYNQRLTINPENTSLLLGDGASNQQQYYVLEYAQGDKLYVPVGLERKLSRYIGFVQPKISRLGSPLWQRTKKKIKEGAEKLAKELLEIYAERELTSRPPYLPSNEIDSQLASSFQYTETPDQLQVIEEIEKDLEKNQPIDRLICGDVGFGKTEIALRTMIRVVSSGFQAVMICPTTILANQHFQNFKERLKNLPVKINLLSRLQSKREQKEITKELREGKIDIIIGTHRILSKDVAFKNLGILVIDDEQRFGVKQKEKLRKMRSSLDILSLSATPIPRTLYLALSSLKKISLIQTPPVGRLPVKTFILPWSEKVIKEAIENEISREGQIYYLHNRIETIRVVKNLLGKLVPVAKIGIAHGRLKEKELIKVMTKFQNKTLDVLVATTIIENGLDFPNVNTLIVADGTRLGLAEAYQIRGRVGRSHAQAFAFFLYGQNLSEKAKMRLDALKEAEALGSGYKIALKDLEIRGAGNILGREQSGNINQVGLNLYCQMISEAVEKLKLK
ncbi:DEAD/DEAH box helicase [Patescibacteria group bacterium]|nr:DEAD/DEAH box helicase [Patescibacteria group bacterium]